VPAAAARTPERDRSLWPFDIAVVDVDGTRCMELRVVSGKTNGTGKHT
jgi:hypothetical protein